ncbi:hypothetical protein CFN78_06890 [Amycolatopsis antarctica]|uniref:Uncharacterized protein n=1 Tax=Amycolatopsis antarctica TaxID=1854586 RepID=A0A263D8Y5_9PSEU|nr:hypothetical protein [Amycolatopsis antarctica]OZM74007.1 hypothetical protein CFN78_06890 [Amycolatopsis antarctica]
MTDETPVHEDVARDLHALADFIAANPQLADYFRYTKVAVNVFPRTDNPTAELAEFARTARRNGAKVTKDGDDEWFFVRASFGGHAKVELNAHREKVCERVQTGTETVTKTVPDPTVDVPMVELTEEVPVYAWECKPLLASTEVTA